MKLFVKLFCSLLIIISASTIEAAKKPVVIIDTSMGSITLELNPRRAPQTVKNFLYYVKNSHYDKTIFHRVIAGFMIQGGGFDTYRVKRPTRPPIRNESNNGLNNDTGTIAMARTSNVDSATTQFYINVNDNLSLNATFKELGYTVFGKVIDGMDVVMKIAGVEVAPKMSLGENAPVKQVVINSVTLVKEKKQDETKSKVKPSETKKTDAVVKKTEKKNLS